MKIDSYLEKLTLGELHRIYKNDSKEYLYLNVCAFNVGAVVRCKLTNDSNQDTSNGYSLVLNNDSLLKSMILATIKNKMESLINGWTKLCYHYSFKEFLGKYYEISESRYDQLNRLIRRV